MRDMTDIERMTENIVAFRRERNWESHHTPRDLAMALSIEAAELLEHFLWRKGDDLEKYIEDHKEGIRDELGDIMFCLLLLSRDLGVDVVRAFDAKLEKTKKKYPIEKVQGRIVKHTEL